MADGDASLLNGWGVTMSRIIRILRKKTADLISALLLGAFVAIGVLFLTYKGHGLHDYWLLEAQLPVKNAQLQAMQLKWSRLEAEVEEWTTDSYYLEKVARQDLHLARTDEKVFILP